MSAGESHKMDALLKNPSLTEKDLKGIYNNCLTMNVAESTHKFTFTFGLSENARPYDFELYSKLPDEYRTKFDIENLLQAYRIDRPDLFKNPMKREELVNRLKTYSMQSGITDTEYIDKRTHEEVGKCK